MVRTNGLVITGSSQRKKRETGPLDGRSAVPSRRQRGRSLVPLRRSPSVAFRSDKPFRITLRVGCRALASLSSSRVLRAQTMVLAAAATRGQRSAHSLATGPVMAEPFISPLVFTITPALSSK